MTAWILTADLMFSSKLTAAARQAGGTLRMAMSTAALLENLAAEPARLVLLDLTTPGLDPAVLVPRIREVVPDAAVLAFGPHVHEDKLAAASAAGCDAVLTRGQLNAGADGLLARYLQPRDENS